MNREITKHDSPSELRKIEILESAGNFCYFEDVVHEAFQNKGGVLWTKIQFQLFEINMRLMSQGFSLGSARAEADWKIRNIIERIEQQYLSREAVPEGLDTPDEFVSWLKIRIGQHRVNHHKLFEYFDSDDLDDEDIRYFLSNYRVNMQRFHLHVAAYSLVVPFEMREELYDNLYDEFGQGDFRQAHPNLFEPLMEYFGGAKESDCNAETCHLLNTKMNLCWFADDLHPGLGGMGALELSIPSQQTHILAHLRRRGLSEELVKFFVIHCELDGEHGDGWFAAGMPYMKTRRDFQSVLSAAVRMLDARAGVYDGILAGILERRNTQRQHTAANSLQDRADLSRPHKEQAANASVMQ